MTVNGIPYFHNRPGVSQVRIGVKKFMCIGDLPPFDHPHIFIDMGDDNEIVCPYCSTLFVYDPRLEGGCDYDPRSEGGCEPAECAYRPETVPELTRPPADISVVIAGAIITLTKVDLDVEWPGQAGVTIIGEEIVVSVIIGGLQVKISQADLLRGLESLRLSMEGHVCLEDYAASVAACLLAI